MPLPRGGNSIVHKNAADICAAFPSQGKQVNEPHNSGPGFIDSNFAILAALIPQKQSGEMIDSLGVSMADGPGNIFGNGSALLFGKRTHQGDEKLTGVDGAVEKLLAENAQSLAMLKEWNEQKQQGSQTETLDTVRAVEDKLEHLSGNIADNAIRQHSLLQDMAVNTENALQDLTRTTEDALQNLQNKLEQQKPADNAELIEATGQIKEMIVNIRLYLDDVQKHVEDYVHKEDVKVYRNVQAVLMEQLSNKTRDLNDHMDALEKSVQKSKGTKPLLVFAILLSAASLTIQILQMLGIL